MLARRLGLLCVLAAAGCQSLLHHKGENQIVVQGFYAEPIKSRALWYDTGRGRARNAGVTASYQGYFTDKLAFIGALTPFMSYDQGGGDVRAVEAQIGLRWMPLQWKTGNLPTGVFIDVLGGIQHAESSVPPAGDPTNFTQDLGLGLEIALGDTTSLVGGYRMRHLSNGGGSSTASNPTQNSHHWFLGFGWRW